MANNPEEVGEEIQPEDESENLSEEDELEDVGAGDEGPDVEEEARPEEAPGPGGDAKAPVRSTRRRRRLHRARLEEPQVMRETDEVDKNAVADLVHLRRMKRLRRKWMMLKRIKEIYNRKIINEQADCLRKRILEFMRNKIARMDHDERHTWILKLTKLSFLLRLKDIRDLKEAQKNEILYQLEKAEEDEREYLLEKLAKLRDLYEIKNMQDAIDVREYKLRKVANDEANAKKIKMMVKMKNLQRITAIRKKEEEALKKQRVERINEVVKQRLDWQNEISEKLDEIIERLTSELAYLEEREEWLPTAKESVDKERKLYEDAILRYTEAKQDKLYEKMEKARIREEIKNKRAFLEKCKQERRRRLWKSERLRNFDRFLDNREKIAQMDENRYFKRIFEKLMLLNQRPSPQTGVESVMNVTDEKIARGKRLRNWVQSILASNKKKVLQKVKMKKFLELFDTPELDKFMQEVRFYPGVEYAMCAVRGRIFKSTFPEKVKHYLARELSLLVHRAILDFSEIDVDDFIVNILIETKDYNLYVGPGKDFYIAVQQKVVDQRPCHEKEDIICLTEKDKEKILALVRERSEGRKTIQDQRLADYAAYQLRKPLDDAWKEYAKNAMVEEIPCWLKKETQRKSGVTHLSYDTERRSYLVDPDTDNIRSVEVSPSPSRHQASQTTRITYEKQMELRRARLMALIEEINEEELKPRYERLEIRHHADVIHKAKLFKNEFVEN